MIGATILKTALPSVIASDLRTALNEAGNERELRACADKLNSIQFGHLPFDEQEELLALYNRRYFKITGALA